MSTEDSWISVTQSELRCSEYEVGEIVSVDRPHDFIPPKIEITKMDKDFGVVYYINTLGQEDTIGFAGISKINK